ncbi:MAG: AI-2E family transporter [Acidobacteria bacterium]|nr:MAG: AI-2E family transporter [Acidobacteriota bacterium]
MRSQWNLARLVLLIAALVVLYFVFQIFRPFLAAIAVAVVLSTLSYPLFEELARRLGGRRGWAALLACVCLTFVIVVPFVILLIMLAQQVSQVYEQVEGMLKKGDFKGFSTLANVPLLGRVTTWLNGIIDLQRFDLVGNLAGLLKQASVFLLSHSTAIVTGLFNLIFDFFIMVVTMFFLFRDGHRLKDELASLSPVSQRYTDLLSDTFRRVARATIVGNLLTALAQGLVSGIIFWSLGVSNALFWGTISAFFSLVPVVGAAIIWIPWAVYFLVTGSIVKGILMIALQALVVGSLDNILRPLLIEGSIRMHTMMVFFSIMGGIAYFGVLGMVFGPIIVALGMTLLEVYKIEVRTLKSPAAPARDESG